MKYLAAHQLPQSLQVMSHPLPGTAGPCVLCEAQGGHQVTDPCRGLQPFPPARAQPAASTAAAPRAAGTGESPSSLVIHRPGMQVTLDIGSRDRTCMKYSENWPRYLIFWGLLVVWFSSPCCWSSVENAGSFLSEHKTGQR